MSQGLGLGSVVAVACRPLVLRTSLIFCVLNADSGRYADFDAENARPENDGQTSGHSRFCAQCADAVAVMPNGCPLCRTPIDMVMRVFIFDVYLANYRKTLFELD